LQDKLRIQTRLASIVILVTAISWLGISHIGGVYGWPPKFAILMDFAALAAFGWAIIVLFRVWRKSREDEGN
jgi:hypothetical protein